MGRMTAAAFRPRRRRDLGVGGVAIEGMDAETLICETIHRFTELERALEMNWIADEETCRRVGWWLVSRTGTAFRIGHLLLRLTALDGYLLPPPEFQLSRQTEPTQKQMVGAPLIHPWGIQLFQSGDVPASWKLSGTVYHREWPEPRLVSRLLYLHLEKKMALTEAGWVKLGKRMHS